MGRFHKLIKISMIAAAFVVWLLLRAGLSEVWSMFKFPMTALNVGHWIAVWDSWPDFLSFVSSWRVIWPELIALVVVFFLYVFSRRSKKIQSFLEDVFGEFAKVTWSTRKEVIASTGVVVIMLAIATVILSLFDILWGTLMGKFLPMKPGSK